MGKLKGRTRKVILEELKATRVKPTLVVEVEYTAREVASAAPDAAAPHVRRSGPDLLRARFIPYRRASAVERSTSALVPSKGLDAAPHDTPSERCVLTGSTVTTIGAWCWSTVGPPGPVSGSSIANSSPPNRANTSETFSVHAQAFPAFGVRLLPNGFCCQEGSPAEIPLRGHPVITDVCRLGNRRDPRRPAVKPQR